jgi:hypothetical protein
MSANGWCGAGGLSEHGTANLSIGMAFVSADHSSSRSDLCSTKSALLSPKSSNSGQDSKHVNAHNGEPCPPLADLNVHV